MNVVSAEQWRSSAQALRATHSVFDRLGARQLSADSFEVWLAVRNTSGDEVLQSTVIRAEDRLATLADLWAGAQWCEREASEAYDLRIGAVDLLLLADEMSRGVMRRERILEPRQSSWPGSHEPSGKSRHVPLGRP